MQLEELKEEKYYLLNYLKGPNRAFYSLRTIITSNIWCISLKFTKSLQKNRDFKVVYDSGKSYATKYLVMYVLKNQTEENRLGISVSKKVGNSIVRHHLKRLVKESYRIHEELFSSGLDIVIVVRRGADQARFGDMEQSLLKLMKNHKQMKSSSEM